MNTLKGEKVAVVGLAASGRAAAQLALEKGGKVHVSDLRTDAATHARGAELRALGAEVDHLGVIARFPDLPADPHRLDRRTFQELFERATARVVHENEHPSGLEVGERHVEHPEACCSEAAARETDNRIEGEVVVGGDCAPDPCQLWWRDIRIDLKDFDRFSRAMVDDVKGVLFALARLQVQPV